MTGRPLLRIRVVFRLVSCAAWLCASASAAYSQTSVPLPVQPAPGTGYAFLPRTAFHVTGEHLSGDDQRFVWNANVGGDVDIFGYPRGRATFLANYEAVLGEQLKAFDPNQGNYFLAAAASRWVHFVELAGVFHHESRHLSDRRKTVPVDWNMVGGRAQMQHTHGAATTTARIDIRKVINQSVVDYEWELDTRVRTLVALRSQVGLVGAFTLDVMGVDGSQGRGTQVGARGEGGVRLQGEAGAIELYLAVERKIDPHQLEFSTASWFIVGFRLLNR